MLRWALVTVLVVFSPVAMATSEDYGFWITNAELVRQNNELVLNADIAYHFSEEAIEALKNGVPLTLTVELKILERRKYIWDKTTVDIKLPFRIRYHALAQLFQVINEASGAQRNFATLESAVQALGVIRGIPIMKAEKLDAQQEHTAKIKVGLDIESLPLPLRPVAYISPDWYLSSFWYKWPLEN